MIRPTTVLALALALAVAVAACARPKSEPSPAASATSAATPASAAIAPEGGSARTRLCSDGFHKPGDHWKEACNPCRCAADGEITCTRFACPAVADAGPKAGDAGARSDAGDAAP